MNCSFCWNYVLEVEGWFFFVLLSILSQYQRTRVATTFSALFAQSHGWSCYGFHPFPIT